ncbi:endo alpha-1,4 polygalactosaminidase [Leucobacter weissii]|uniref:Endo alpha-1,4 polygalactosaminidase n=1 Tax=Leucobacter weissii TaxID=1983706 RepID=A0A939S7U7_9MICO|nr:endo alpha-1,4 polygalactosaminidase [Leucobacter weissii]
MLGRRSRAPRALIAAALAILLPGCVSASPNAAPPTAPSPPVSSPTIVLPPVGAIPDYQLGGAYEPADEVGAVGRDRLAAPVEGAYSICYVNGFQTQPGELETWPDELLLHDEGVPVMDPDWPDEALLDTSTAAKRARILDTVGPWISGCAADGFDAVEFDNLDSYTRSDGRLDLADNLALAASFAETAHAAGLAAGQKNAAEDAAQLRTSAGFDFALVEECAAWEECAAYADVYGDRVIDIEYTDRLPRSFAAMCRDPGSPRSMVLRDRALSAPDDPDHVFESCDAVG